MQRTQHVAVREGYDRWARVYDHDGNPLVALDETVVPPLLGEVVGAASSTSRAGRAAIRAARRLGRVHDRRRFFEHPIVDYVNAALAAGLRIERLEEHKGTDELGAAWPRARKYVGWPMLFAMRAAR